LITIDVDYSLFCAKFTGETIALHDAKPAKSVLNNII